MWLFTVTFVWSFFSFAYAAENYTCGGCDIFGGSESAFSWNNPEFFLKETVHVYLDPVDNTTISTSVEANTKAASTYSSICDLVQSTLGAQEQYAGDCIARTSVVQSDSLHWLGPQFTGTMTLSVLARL